MTERGPEAVLMDQIIGRGNLTDVLGWEVLHIRPGRTAHGWSVPISGSLGEGWPDLLLARPPRLVAAELKAPGKRPTAAQERVLGVLGLCGVDTYVWRPDDWDAIVEALR